MRARAGFTLIELLIAGLISAMTISAIFLTLNAAIRAFHAGEMSMDLYQSARLGMERLAAEVRQAISPQSFWKRRLNPGQGAAVTTLASLLAERRPGDVDLEADTIVFKGSTSTVSFVQIEADLRLDPPYDLREYEFRVNEDGQLLKSSSRSVLAEQMAAWRAMRFPDEEEAVFPTLLSEAQTGVELRESVLTERVLALRLKYYDGENWRDSWDSEEIITPQNVNPEEIPYGPGERPVKLGLPVAVEIVMTFEGNHAFYTITEVPASLLNLIPHEKTGKAISRGGTRYQRDRKRSGGSSVLPPMIEPGAPVVLPPSISRHLSPTAPAETRFR